MSFVVADERNWLEDRARSFPPSCQVKMANESQSTSSSSSSSSTQIFLLCRAIIYFSPRVPSGARDEIYKDF